MFLINLKKEWRMNKSLLITFFGISLLLLAVIAAVYVILKTATLSDMTTTILIGVWAIFAGLTSMVSTVFSIVLTYFVFKNDLGKNNVQYTVFTPQSIFEWLMPKLLFIFLVQGLFAIISVSYSYFLLDITTHMAGGAPDIFGASYYWTLFLTQTFSFGFFALVGVIMAIYYSFRNKTYAWLLIVGSAILYFIATEVYAIYTVIRMGLGYTMNISQTEAALYPYLIKNSVGLLFFVIAYYLFDKKIEY